jgi:hypothetical protein
MVSACEKSLQEYVFSDCIYFILKSVYISIFKKCCITIPYYNDNTNKYLYNKYSNNYYFLYKDVIKKYINIVICYR